MQSGLGTAFALRKVSNGIGGGFARTGQSHRQLRKAYRQAVLYGEVLIESLGAGREDFFCSFDIVKPYISLMLSLVIPQSGN